MNTICIIGNLTRDPELRYSAAGKEFAKFGIAYNDKRGDKENVLFIDVLTFGKTALFCSDYLKKGNKVGITGKLAMESWTDNAGSKRTSYSIVAERVDNLTPREQAGRNQPEEKAPVKRQEKIPEINVDEDDGSSIPF